jgi:DNA-binding transcriptional regulator LsrR (DeoR family)
VSSALSVLTSPCPTPSTPTLSVELATASGLCQAIVVDTADEPVSTLQADLGRVAANLLAELVQEDDVVGIAWGRTVNAMTAALSDIKRCSIVQVTPLAESGLVQALEDQ